jgi:phosphoglycerate dehydrogenase-like enzyme
VNQDDLIEVLTKREIAGAGLDVFEHEPLANSPLTRLDNVILTAHTAGVDTLASEEMAYLAAKTAVEVLRGEWPAEMIINPEARKTV